MTTPFEVLLAVVGIGGQLGSSGDKLRMALPPDCSPDLREAIRRHKAAMLDLMRLTFLVVDSGALKTTIFFVPNEAVKDSLVAAGAKRHCIYSASELEELVRRGVSTGDLSPIHAAKQQFNGRVIRRASDAERGT